jgi:signal transduction histidine kinase
MLRSILVISPPFIAAECHATGAGAGRHRPLRGFDFVREDDLRVVPPDDAGPPGLEYLQIVKRFLPFARRYWFDAVILGLTGIGVTGAVLGRNRAIGPEGPLWLDVLAMLAIVLPLLARRRFPFGAPVAVGVAAASISFVDKTVVPFDGVVFMVGCAALFLVGSLRDRAQAFAGFAVAEGVAAVVVHNDPSGGVGDFIVASIIFTIVWSIAFGVGRKSVEADEARERAARAEREREERAHLAVADERARIARELHDVVGHSVSVMTVQASAVRRLLQPDQQREREALLIVERTGREALAEMRRMVGVLRRPEEAPALAPQPSLEHLGKLVEQARDAGLPVELRVEGEFVQLPAGVDLTAYRLIQEGLTNAIKHAHATLAEVLVRYKGDHVELAVSDDGSGGGGGDGGGHGLVGMRERVLVYGGELEAGPRPSGGFRLRAKLPITPT